MKPETTKLSRWLMTAQITIDSVESIFVDLIAAVVPWFAPIIPAYMAYINMTTVLDFSPIIAFIGAMVIELLGLATVHTVFWLWDYNDTSRKSDQKDHGRAPVAVALSMSAFYLVIVVLVNVLLDQNSPPVEIAAKAVLTLISIPAAVTVAVRSQHKRRLQDVKEGRGERQAERRIASLETQLRKVTEELSAKVSESERKRVEVSPTFAETEAQLTGKAAEIYSILQRNPRASNTEIGETVGVSRQYAGQVRKFLNGSVSGGN